MASTISSTTAEIFLQHIENIHFKQMPDTNNILFYTIYVDDILLKYITTETIHKYINQLHPNLQLYPTHKSNNSISFLDLLITY